MRRPVVSLLAAVVVTGAAVGGGVLARGDGSPSTSGSRPPSPSSSIVPFSTTPLAAFDANGVSVRRAAFCDRIDPRQVTAALGGPAVSQRSWADGDRVALEGNPADVVHEFGCEYVAADGTAARAWVFAPPVGAAQAARLLRQTVPGWCTTSTSTFGAPSGQLSCLKGTELEQFRGLFGDAWLSCEVEAPAPPAQQSPPDPGRLADRAGRWCVGVARAASSAG